MSYQAQKSNKLLFNAACLMLGVVIASVALTDRTPAPAQEEMAVLLPKPIPEEVVIAEEPAIDQAEFECLRTNLYHEAGNQGRKGMEAVALVTLNRTKTKHFPPTICEVVTVKAKNKRGKWVCAFSWYCDGKSDAPNLTLTVRVGNKKKTVPNKQEVEAWELATAVATEAMEGKLHDFLGRATHYHANYVNPDWSLPVNAKRYHYLTRVGSHLFYRDVKLKLKA